MNFEKLRADVEEKKDMTDFFLKREKEGEFYPAYDCDLKDFNSRFEGVLSFKTIPEYLDQNYNDKKGELIGIELGGPGCKLFTDLEGYFAKTIGITLYHKPELIIPSGHQVIEADVFTKRTQKDEGDLKGYQVIEEWVRKNGKADLLICSMGDGVNYGLNVDLFVANLKRWYKLLSSQGTIFLSLPDIGYNDFVEGLEKFLSKNKDVFQSILCPGGGGLNMMLHKLVNAPESIDQLVHEALVTDIDESI